MSNLHLWVLREQIGDKKRNKLENSFHNNNNETKKLIYNRSKKLHDTVVNDRNKMPNMYIKINNLVKK